MLNSIPKILHVTSRRNKGFHTLLARLSNACSRLRFRNKLFVVSYYVVTLLVFFSWIWVVNLWFYILFTSNPRTTSSSPFNRAHRLLVRLINLSLWILNYFLDFITFVKQSEFIMNLLYIGWFLHKFFPCERLVTNTSVGKSQHWFLVKFLLNRNPQSTNGPEKIMSGWIFMLWGKFHGD